MSKERILRVCVAYVLDRSFSLFVDFWNNRPFLFHVNSFVCTYLPHQSSTHLKTCMSSELILQIISRTVYCVSHDPSKESTLAI